MPEPGRKRPSSMADSKFLKALDSLESLSRTREHLLKAKSQKNLSILYDAIGSTISFLTEYLNAESDTFFADQLNNIARRLEKLTCSLRTGQEAHDSDEKYTKCLEGLNEVLVGIFVEWETRLKPKGWMRDGDKTLAENVEDWASQKELIHKDCEIVLGKLEGVISAALEKISKGVFK